MSAATNIAVRVPLAIRRRGGRNLVVTPDGGSAPGAHRHAHGPIRRW
jgi:hypothetical protein